MEPFKCYTYKEAISNEMGFIRIQPQVYSRLINNLQRVGNLIYKYNLELKRDPRKTAQISEPPQGGQIFTEVFDAMLRIGRKIDR